MHTDKHASGPSAKERILVVVSDPLLRLRLLQAFQVGGYPAMGAASAKEALCQSSADCFDLAIIDLRLRGKSGLGLAKQLKRLGTQVILLAEPADRAGLLHRFNGTLSLFCKPLNCQQVLESVTHMFSHRKYHVVQRVLHDSGS